VRKGAAVALLASLAIAAPAGAAEAPKRIVTLTPFTSDTVAALGIRPVGIGLVLGESEPVSKRLKGVPVLPLSHPNGPNLEQLASLDPQLVLSSSTWRKGHATMRELHMRVVESDPRRVRDVPKQTKRLGELLHKPVTASRIVAQQKRLIKASKRGIKRHPRVLLILGIGRTPVAFLPNSWGGDVVRQAGGRLLTKGLRSSGGFARISDEVVVDRNPDVIIAVPHGNPDEIDRIADYMRDNPAWQSTNAAKNDRVYVSTGNSLLQPWADPSRVIRTVRTKFLKNG
jgi:ABC-type Fe3+-hydroxamate transport system substrate-binding protein